MWVIVLIQQQQTEDEGKNPAKGKLFNIITHENLSLSAIETFCVTHPRH